jgi:hypothetical protein
MICRFAPLSTHSQKLSARMAALKRLRERHALQDAGNGPNGESVQISNVALASAPRNVSTIWRTRE